MRYESMLTCLLLSIGLLAAEATPSRSAESVAAVVNGTGVTVAEVDEAFERTRFAKRKLTAQKERLYRRRVLDVLINDRLLQQHLKERGIAVDENRVQRHIDEIRRQAEANGGTLDNFLAERGIDQDAMRRDIRDLHRWLAFAESQAGEKTLKSFFETHSQQFDGSEMRVSHILVKAPVDATEGERKSARAKIEQIRAQMSAGAAFAELARKHSECPSKSRGGDLGFFPHHAMTDAFASAAFALPVGEFSGVVETEFGYHLLLATDKKPGKPVKYEQVAAEVEAVYIDDLRAKVIARMRRDADIAILR